MTRRRELERHRRGLIEIREIMDSMKTLAYIEVRKLARFLDAQQTVVRGIETVAADFLAAYPLTLPEAGATTAVYLLIGSERGFCGDFNTALVHHLRPALRDTPARLVATGRKLHPLLEDEPRVAAWIEGADVAEDVPAVLTRLVDTLLGLQARHGPLTLYVTHHGADGGILTQRLLPPFKGLEHTARRFAHPPLLNLPPKDLLLELTEHYLFAALHAILYTSLIAENRSRMAHLEGAVRHLDERSAALLGRCNALRQEEIIEEIEVILLSAAGLAPSTQEASPTE